MDFALTQETQALSARSWEEFLANLENTAMDITRYTISSHKDRSTEKRKCGYLSSHFLPFWQKKTQLHHLLYVYHGCNSRAA
jgi:hypothetical protein